MPLSTSKSFSQLSRSTALRSPSLQFLFITWISALTCSPILLTSLATSSSLSLSFLLPIHFAIHPLQQSSFFFCLLVDVLTVIVRFQTFLQVEFYWGQVLFDPPQTLLVGVGPLCLLVQLLPAGPDSGDHLHLVWHIIQGTQRGREEDVGLGHNNLNRYRVKPLRCDTHTHKFKRCLPVDGPSVVLVVPLEALDCPQ